MTTWAGSSVTALKGDKDPASYPLPWDCTTRLCAHPTTGRKDPPFHSVVHLANQSLLFLVPLLDVLGEVILRVLFNFRSILHFTHHSFTDGSIELRDRVSSLRLGGCGFDPLPGHTKDKKKKDKNEKNGTYYL